MGKRFKNKKTISVGNATLEISTYSVDIIIPVYNRFDLLSRCLDALPSAFMDEYGQMKFRVTLVDNGSTEEGGVTFYREVSGKYDFPVIVYKLGKNMGFPVACNYGAKKGTAPYIFFLNSDVILDSGAGKHLVKYLASDPKGGIAGMKLVFPDDVAESGLNPRIRPAGKIQHVGLFTNVHANFIHIFSGWSEDNPRVNNIKDAHAVTGAALLIGRKLYNEIGGFYEGYGKGTWEDIELCMEAHRRGYNILVDLQARGVHYTGATAEKYKISYPLNENRNIFMSRWSEMLVHSDWRAW